MEAVARAVFRAYNYHEIRTPILEETQLFARGVGEETDIVTKEMYTFDDRDDTSLTLRPENTASVIRAYIEHRLDQRPGVQKLYYIGPMFRRERPQKGRYRQFFQIGAEAIGSESPVVDAEVIEMVVEILKRVGLSGFQAADQLRGRPQLPAAVRRAAARGAEGTSRRRCAAIASAARRPIRCACSIARSRPTSRSSTSCPHIPDYLCEACRAHFDAVKQFLDGSRDRIRSPAAPGARPRLLHAHDVRSRARLARRAELRAGRRPLRRPRGVARLEGPRAGHRLFDRRRPPRDERRRRSDRRAGWTCSSRRSGEAAVRHAAVDGARRSAARAFRWNWWKAS